MTIIFFNWVETSKRVIHIKIKLIFGDKLKRGGVWILGFRRGWCVGVGEFLAELIVDTCI